MSYRIGIGYDIHQTQKGNEVVLGGVKISAPFSLKGHSDADVLLHALTDSILGALGEKDIGFHFPDHVSENKARDSRVFLEYSLSLMQKRGFHIVNLDMNLICEKPRLGEYRDKIENHIASLMSIDVARVNLKAKTNEQLDAIGQQKAVAAQVVVLLTSTKPA